MKNSIYFNKALRTLSALMACFVVMMSFVGVPEAFASGASAGEILTATETVECEVNVTLNGEVPGTAANYASVGVQAGSFSGGARLNLFTDNGYPAVWTITPTHTGTVTIDLVQTHTSSWQNVVKFDVNGTETFNSKLSGWTGGTDRIATDISVTEGVPFTITWTPGGATAERPYFDCFNLTYSYLASGPILTDTETVECEVNVTLNGAVPGTAANYASVGVQEGSFSGGARLNLFTDNSYPAVWTITPTYTGTVDIDLVHTHTSSWQNVVKFDVNGTETFNSKLSGWTGGTDTIATDVSVTKGVPFTITWTPGGATAERPYFDCFNLTYSYLEADQVQPVKPLIANTVLTAADAELADGAEAIGDEVKIPVDGTATYKANESSSNKAYKLYVNLSSGSEVGARLNDEDLGLISVSATGEDVFVCDFVAPNGENTIELYATNEEVVVTDVKIKEIKKGEIPEVPLYMVFEAAANGAIVGSSALTETSSAYKTADTASNQKYIQTNARPIKWSFTPTESGYYTFDLVANGDATLMDDDSTFTVDSATVFTGVINTASGWNIANAKTTRLFKQYFEAGTTYEIAWATAPVGTTTIDHFNVYYEESISLDINGIFVGNEAIADGKVIPRGTDTFMVELTNTVDASALSIADITLDGVDFELGADDNKLYIYLKDTLDYNTDYTLDIQDIVGAYGAPFGTPKTVTFTTSDAAGDEGSATAEITEGSVTGADITISGIVKSSAGKGIKGRTLNVKVLKDGSQIVNTSIGTSEDDGAFTYTYTAGTDISADGLYSFLIEPEYGTWSTAKDVPYITEAGKTAALEALKATTDQATVNAWFASYKAAFGLTLMDNTGISDESLLNAHFIGADYTTAGKDAFVADYADYLILERMLQGNATVVAGLLTDEEANTTLGIDKNKYALLTGANKTGFETALVALELSGVNRTIEKFAEEYNTLINTYLVTESGKTTPVLKNDTVSGVANQTVAVPVSFTAEFEDLSKLTLVVSCPSADIANALTFAPIAALSNDVSATKTVSGSTATFVITKKLYNDKFTTLGYLEFASTTTGSYTLNLSGDVEVVIANADSSVKSTFAIALAAKSVTVSFVAEGTDLGTGNSNWPGGGGGGGGSSKDDKDDKDDETKDPAIDPVVTPSTEFKFNDLGNVDWAVESIEALLKDGIISQSEDKKFNPENNVLREEYIKMLVIALDIPETDVVSGFGDVNENEWYAPYIARAKAAGLVLGNDEGNFGIGEKITRQDMATMTARALEALSLEYAEKDELFADDADIADYAKAPVKMMKSLGIINGVGENKFEPNGVSTRAMAAKVIYEMRKVVAQ